MRRLFIILFAFTIQTGFAQLRFRGAISGNDIDYANPKEYEIGGVTVSGTQYLDINALVALSGLVIGEKIKVPGDKISGAIQKLWKQELFGDIQVEVTKIQGNRIFFNLVLQERPRLSKFTFAGIRRSEADELRDKIKLIKGRVVNDNLISNTKNTVYNYYRDKGFLNAKVNIAEETDTTLSNSVILKINIDKNRRVKINELIVHGNKDVKAGKVKRWLKETKQRQPLNIFRNSKYIEKKFEEDKVNVIEKYNSLGYRDAKILRDTMYRVDEKRINIELDMYEGPKYYFGNIAFTGNTKYTSVQLAQVLGIKKGDIYDKTVLSTRLNGSPNSSDVSSLYLDDGYLFFNVTPVETQVYNDTIDLEIRIYEGSQATINKVTVKGNEKTNDKVIMREIRTKPGQKFSRSDIIRTQRELVSLGYFDPEKFGVAPKPNPADGTVDIEYTVAEKPSDQIELQGGYGGGIVVGTLGLTFNNFSGRNFFKGHEWDPIPAGDGQRISLRAQTSGYFTSFAVSFAEPWLGGKKPNNFSVTASHTRYGSLFNESNTYTHVNGLSVGLGKRLKFPDDYFTLSSSLSLQQYKLKNSSLFIFSTGESYNLNLTEVLARSSVDQPIYPRSGSLVSLTIQLTPPYSLLNGKDYTHVEVQEKYKLVEYHKWKFDASWYTSIFGNLVLNSKVQFGFLGYYNTNIGLSPFERFLFGGSGLVYNNPVLGSETIPLRGYPDNKIIPNTNFLAETGETIGSPIFNKYSLELRHPLTLNQSATIYVLAFAEAGNTFARFREFTPFDVKRSAGVGVRIFLPVFGMLGLDYGWGFDKVPGLNRDNKGEFHFSIGQQF